MPHNDAIEQYRRMLFNIIARNQDDHTKNIAFVLDQTGIWRLSPAFDMTYSYNPDGEWTSMHQMTVGGKRDKFTKKDLEDVGRFIKVPNPSLVIDEIVDVVAGFRNFANEAGVDKKKAMEIERNLRLKW